MQPLEVYKQTPSVFELIDYSKPPNPYRVPSTHYLTEYESHMMNQGFALNGTTKRYIRREPRVIRKK